MTSREQIQKAVLKEVDAKTQHPQPGDVVLAWDEDTGYEGATLALYRQYKPLGGKTKYPHDTMDGESYTFVQPHPNYMRWRKWEGGECPVNGDVLVAILHRDGDCFMCRAVQQNWEHMSDADVVAYAVVTTPDFDL